MAKDEAVIAPRYFGLREKGKLLGVATALDVNQPWFRCAWGPIEAFKEKYEFILLDLRRQATETDHDVSKMSEVANKVHELIDINGWTIEERTTEETIFKRTTHFMFWLTDATHMNGVQFEWLYKKLMKPKFYEVRVRRALVIPDVHQDTGWVRTVLAQMLMHSESGPLPKFPLNSCAGFSMMRNHLAGLSARNLSMIRACRRRSLGTRRPFRDYAALASHGRLTETKAAGLYLKQMEQYQPGI